MALRKESFDEHHERARTMKNDKRAIHQDSVPIEISRKIYQRAESAARGKHITTRQYLEQILEEAVPAIGEVMKPGHPISRESLERLEQIGEELFRRNNFQYLGDSVKEIREMREERLQQLMGEDKNNE